MKPITATHIDANGNYWRLCHKTRHWERCIDGVWTQDDSADNLYPLDEAPPNEIKHTYEEAYNGGY